MAAGCLQRAMPMDYACLHRAMPFGLELAEGCLQRAMPIGRGMTFYVLRSGRGRAAVLAGPSPLPYYRVY